MNKVLQFPKSSRIRPWEPPQIEANSESLSGETESLIAEARARMFCRVFAEVVELVELCEELISEGGFSFDSEIENAGVFSLGPRPAVAPTEDRE